VKDKEFRDRRTFVKLCGAASALVATNPGLLAQTSRPLQLAGKTLLVDVTGKPLRAEDLEVGASYVFNYPYVSTPCFLINLGRPVEPRDDLQTEDGRRYRWQGGVGPQRSLVAFSAICAHRMSYPTPTVSFISYRHEGLMFSGRDQHAVEREQVIYCCSEGSVYDPAAGAEVLGGPAPQPLASVAMTHEPEHDALFATGTYGGEMFERFFETFGFQLALQNRSSDVRRPVSDSTVVQTLEQYSRNARVC